MSIGNYGDLKAAVVNWLARDELTGEAADFISLAEARLNRQLDPVETDTTLTGTAGSRTVDISALSVDRPIALFMARDGVNEYELTEKQAGTYPFVSVAGLPRYWSRDGETIVFDRELDGDYPFRFRFAQKFSLSATATTNWLLTNYPDLYLAACMLWGGLFIMDSAKAAGWEAIVERLLPEVKNAIAQSKRSTLTVDPALQRIGQTMHTAFNNTGALEWP